LRHEAEFAAQPVGRHPRIETGDPDFAGVGSDQGRQHRERSGLAGAIGPEQPDHFAGLHAECQIIDGQTRAVAFTQVSGFNQGGRRHRAGLSFALSLGPF
jgi:hypothetical protein